MVIATHEILFATIRNGKWENIFVWFAQTDHFKSFALLNVGLEIKRPFSESVSLRWLE